MFNKKIRELKREVRELDKALDSEKSLSDEREYENAKDNVELKKAKIELKEKILAKERAFKECEDEVSKLKLKVREQTEADLFFTSSKICAKLLKGKKKEDVKVEVDKQKELSNQIEHSAHYNYLRQLQEQRMPSRDKQQLGMRMPWGGLYGRTLEY